MNSISFADTVKYFSIISAVLTFLIAVFYKENWKYENYRKLYFDKFLVSYINLYKKDQDTNPIYFYYSIYTDYDNYLPPYIRYLIDENNKDVLTRVLISDYLQEYPSLQNTISKCFRKIIEIFYYILYIFFFVLFILFMFYALVGVISIISEFSSKMSGSVMGIPDYLFFPVSFFVMVGVLYFQLKCVDHDTSSLDVYTLNKKKIKKIIAKRTKSYEKLIKKHYIQLMLFAKQIGPPYRNNDL